MLISLLCLGACGDSRDGAPKGSEWPSEVAIGHITEVGTPVGFGGPMTLINDSHHDVTIDGVELESGNTELSLVGWALRDVDGGTWTGVQEPFPPPDARAVGSNLVTPTVRNANGAFMPGTEVVIGVRSNPPGQWTATGVRGRYSEAGARHTIVFPLIVELCAPKADYPEGCTASAAITG